tara:strand:+ start:537 stop:896 length:360 start_codon:yes stop_codon:yes gene_type:complete
MTTAYKTQKRIRRHKKVKAKIAGIKTRPRLCVFRSNKHIYAQIIDDASGVTLASSSDKEKDFAKVKGSKTLIAKEVGKNLSKKAQKKKISEVVFDRSGFIFTGRVKALAEGAREEGLKF